MNKYLLFSNVTPEEAKIYEEWDRLDAEAWERGESEICSSCGSNRTSSHHAMYGTRYVCTQCGHEEAL